MTTIKEFLQIDASKIEDQKTQDLVKQFQEDAKEATDAELQEDDLQETIDEIYDMVKQLAPDAIEAEPASPCVDPSEMPTKEVTKSKTTKKPKLAKKAKSSKSQKKKEKPANKPKISRDELVKETAKLNKKAQHCKLMLKKHYAEIRKLKGPTPKPTRYQKIKSHFLSIGNLIPDKLKNDLEVQQETEKILLRAHRQIIDAFGMSTIKAKKDQEAIKEKYDRIEEKISK